MVPCRLGELVYFVIGEDGVILREAFLFLDLMLSA
jgi:hypothetical protein